MLPGLSGGTVNRPRRKEEELRNSGALFEEAMCWLGERLQHYVIRPRVLSAAELEVETDLQHVSVRLDAGIRKRDTGAAYRWGADQRARAVVTEPVVIVLDKPGEPVREGVFTADASRPAALCRACA